MALVTPVFLDTTVLLGGLIEVSPKVDPAQRIMAAVSDGRIRKAATAWHCCLEFYSVATRLPEEFRLSPDDALRLLEEEILGRLEILRLPERLLAEFLRDVASDRVVGGRVYDAHIAAIARSGGAKIVVTENRRHFSSLLRYGIKVLNAEEFASEHI